MIHLDDHRKANLEMMFQHATDRDLLHELVRRGRFQQIQAHTMFWPEMRDEPRYMDSIRKRVLYLVASALADANIAPVFLQERPHPLAALDKDFKLPDDVRETMDYSKMSVLTADVIVLRSRDKAKE